MSSILKALKKLEAENAVTRRDPIRIDAEILHAPPPPRISPMGITLAAALLFVCGGSVTYVYMGRNRQVPPQEIAAHNGIVNPPRQQSTPESSVVAAEAEGKKEGTLPSPDDVPHSRSRPVSSTTRRLQPQSAGEPAKPTGQTVSEQRNTVHISHAAPALQAPTLRVDGIAFQDGAEGVAVVNGVPVSRGVSVEGARVVEVQRDRVLFSYAGKKIEVFMGKSNR